MWGLLSLIFYVGGNFIWRGPFKRKGLRLKVENFENSKKKDSPISLGHKLHHYFSVNGPQTGSHFFVWAANWKPRMSQISSFSKQTTVSKTEKLVPFLTPLIWAPLQNWDDRFALHWGCSKSVFFILYFYELPSYTYSEELEVYISSRQVNSSSFHKNLFHLGCSI